MQLLKRAVVCADSCRNGMLFNNGSSMSGASECANEFQSFSTGSRIANRYEVIRSLGAGRVGAVFHVKDHGDASVTYALKIFRRLFHRFESTVALIERELASLQSLRHPGIAKIISYGKVAAPGGREAEELVYVVREFVEGKSLPEWLVHNAQSGICLQEACDYLSQILSALEYLHSTGNVHSELRPSNILRTDDGCIVLTDLCDGTIIKEDGRAMISRRWCELVDKRLRFVQYAAPEERLGLGRDHRSEIYRVAMLAHELASGSPPFDLAPPLPEITKGLKHPFPRLCDLRRDVPEWYQAVVDRASRYDASERLQTAAEMRRYLEERAAPPPLPTSETHWMQRYFQRLFNTRRVSCQR